MPHTDLSVPIAECNYYSPYPTDCLKMRTLLFFSLPLSSVSVPLTWFLQCQKRSLNTRLRAILFGEILSFLLFNFLIPALQSQWCGVSSPLSLSWGFKLPEAKATLDPCSPTCAWASGKNWAVPHHFAEWSGLYNTGECCPKLFILYVLW